MARRKVPSFDSLPRHEKVDAPPEWWDEEIAAAVKAGHPCQSWHGWEEDMLESLRGQLTEVVLLRHLNRKRAEHGLPARTLSSLQHRWKRISANREGD